jgi:hypothetical protein
MSSSSADKVAAGRGTAQEPPIAKTARTMAARNAPIDSAEAHARPTGPRQNAGSARSRSSQAVAQVCSSTHLFALRRTRAAADGDAAEGRTRAAASDGIDTAVTGTGETLPRRHRRLPVDTRIDGRRRAAPPTVLRPPPESSIAGRWLSVPRPWGGRYRHIPSARRFITRKISLISCQSGNAASSRGWGWGGGGAIPLRISAGRRLWLDEPFLK